TFGMDMPQNKNLITAGNAGADVTFCERPNAAGSKDAVSLSEPLSQRKYLCLHGGFCVGVNRAMHRHGAFSELYFCIQGCDVNSASLRVMSRLFPRKQWRPGSIGPSDFSAKRIIRGGLLGLRPRGRERS